ncbi:hypothetical protein JMJ56_18535 [Belnapia sp. T18]|uniref:Type III secretion apparatus protein, YscD/HrpQ family n=1 Tax=Belnapia arida TaxID=2804533 RepID=A0ABS1U5T1_9PROT|nr:FHA domain-containing protein [Belnapia arida]MBL6080022.1 hypothetical protein [Belnapia arida]
MLHVLDGPSKGGEIVLAEGEWLVGSGPEADVTFVEPMLAPAHLRIRLVEGAVFIAALGDDVLVGGVPLTAGEERTLAALTPVKVGATSFALGPCEADWNSIALNAPTQVLLASAGEDTMQAMARETPSPERLSRRAPWLAAAAAVLVTAGAAARWALAPVPPPPAAPTASPVERTRTVLASLEMSGTVAAAASGDRVAVTGQVASDEQVARLVAALRWAGVAADVSVITDAMLAESILTVVRSFTPDASVQVVGPGHVELDGFMPGGDDAVESMIRQLRTDVPGLRQAVDRMVTPARARAALEQALPANGIVAGVQISATSRGFRVVGEGSPEGIARWPDVAREFEARFGHWLQLEAELLPTATVEPSGVKLGHEPYLVMGDGQRLGIGDRIGEAWRITAIEARKLRAASAAGEIELPYARPPNWVMEDGTNER